MPGVLFGEFSFVFDAVYVYGAVNDGVFLDYV